MYYKPSHFKYQLLAWTLPELVLVPKCSINLDHRKTHLKDRANKIDSTRISRSKSPKNVKTNKAIISVVDKSTRNDKGRKSLNEKQEKEDSPINLYNPPLFYLGILK